MTILNDKQIIDLDSDPFPMIEPFERQQVKQVTTHSMDERIVSYGTSSFGYDARLANEFKEPIAGVLDPKHPELATWRSWEQDGRVVIPPHGFYLAKTLEYFRIPDDVFVICLGKSTYARNGLIVNVTPLEPGWEGHVTLELSNTTNLPSVVYVGEGICQFVFFRGERPAVSYGDRNGKYQGQRNVTLARV
jgi:dCTP deaminase